MSTDKITTEQRKGIHDRARTIGYNEGLRSGINQLAAYLGPEIGKVSLYALEIVIDTKVDENRPSQLKRFRLVPWTDLGAETLEELSALTKQDLIDTQPNQNQGEVFAQTVSDSLAVFNLSLTEFDT